MSTLKSSRHPMSADIEVALRERKLVTAYLRRPSYQQNDYLDWIERAKRDVTRARRLEQMLSELEDGKTYMRMPWRTSRD